MADQAIFEVEDVFVIEGRGAVAIGRLIGGIIKKGMKSNINEKQSEILGIEVEGNQMESLTAGMSAGLLLTNIEKGDIQKGDKYYFQ